MSRATRGPGVRALAVALVVTLCLVGCAFLGGRDEKTRVVIWFDEYDEVLVGQALSRGSALAGSILDVTNERGDIRCVGQSGVRIVPPAASPPTHCDGMHGIATLTCSDGREISLDYSLEESCASGYGEGRDHDGHGVHSVFGGSRAHVETMAREARTHLAGRKQVPEAGTRADDEAPAPATNTGTAFFVTWEGHLVTNFHVIKDHVEIQVQLADGDRVDVEVIGTDEENDLAVLRVDAIRHPLALHLGEQLVKGEEVFALGYPLVALQGQEQKATFGRVNALSGIQGDRRFTQVDVPIQPGNSGGPLLNRRGEVVGVMTSMLDQHTVFERVGVIPQNVNYALKPSYVEALLEAHLGTDWTPAATPAAEREFSALVEEAQDSVVLVVAW